MSSIADDWQAVEPSEPEEELRSSAQHQLSETLVPQQQRQPPSFPAMPPAAGDIKPEDKGAPAGGACRHMRQPAVRSCIAFLARPNAAVLLSVYLLSCYLAYSMGSARSRALPPGRSSSNSGAPMCSCSSLGSAAAAAAFATLSPTQPAASSSMPSATCSSNSSSSSSESLKAPTPPPQPPCSGTLTVTLSVTPPPSTPIPHPSAPPPPTHETCERLAASLTNSSRPSLAFTCCSGPDTRDSVSVCADGAGLEAEEWCELRALEMKNIGDGLGDPAHALAARTYFSGFGGEYAGVRCGLALALNSTCGCSHAWEMPRCPDLPSPPQRLERPAPSGSPVDDAAAARDARGSAAGFRVRPPGAALAMPEDGTAGAHPATASNAATAAALRKKETLVHIFCCALAGVTLVLFLALVGLIYGIIP